ncbi:hypothetical protein B296_00040728 [Ensete ventricosum]|uniref:Uncharacterized protein n=1 Tax=Ensete ventricosum TaxID=4639 RepID=A0A426ZMA3_ENSVE|nr:hypothetical protein B296_00040728 [Ensete ventricosum]
MPPQDRAPIKDVDLEMMSMNLKEGGCCVVNRDKDLTAVDFGGDVSLAEKEVAVSQDHDDSLTAVHGAAIATPTSQRRTTSKPNREGDRAGSKLMGAYWRAELQATDDHDQREPKRSIPPSLPPMAKKLCGFNFQDDGRPSIRLIFALGPLTFIH